ncbi:NASP-related protein sim3 [Macadamia integrifolia]|uniref:NASP-related protein sim3 n=1 Tax=Macadamia integrifolia TaxID=60698 RepID=UPI001C4E507B|nr:NASP-related protein sim3 [Macadamia integrifolia]
MASSAEAPTTMGAVTSPEENTDKEPEPLSVKVDETVVTVVQETLASDEAMIDSKGQGGVESSGTFAGDSSTSADNGTEKTLEHAAELMEKGSKALKESDYTEAAECFSRAVEIRVAHYGELAPECAVAYYKYGCALLYKAQEEADPLGTMPKKEVNSQQNSSGHETTMKANDGECSITSAVSEGKQAEASIFNGEEQVNGAGDDDQVEEGDGESEDEDLAEVDEDESDLDLAWKMLDIARAIVERHPGDTMEKVDILSALAEVALEREDIETSISDYLKALSILECLVEPDSRQIAELNFRICLCLEVGSKAQEAIPYCQRALSICKAQVGRLINEVNELKRKTCSGEAMDVADPCQKNQQSFAGSQAEPSVSEKESEIGTLKELSSELERKLEDLQQLVLTPSSIFSEVLKMVSAKATGNQKCAPSTALSSSQMGTVQESVGFDSPTVSTGHTKETVSVTHLGVVGRGIKRPLTNPGSTEPSPLKKPLQDSSEGKSGVDPIPVEKNTLESSGEKSDASIS